MKRNYYLLFACLFTIVFALASCNNSKNQDVLKSEQEQTKDIQCTDIDGNTYSVVIIGDQEWLTKNLNVSKFQNGDVIPQATSEQAWKDASNAGNPVWCYYKFDSKHEKDFGKLYNWYAVNDERGLAPKGWKVPTVDEWQQLINFLGGKTIACSKLKNTSGWTNTEVCTNESGFTGIPCGRYDYGYFNDDTYCSYWWCSSQYDDDDRDAWYVSMCDESKGEVGAYRKSKDACLSIRCIKQK